jgi:hypothetical protein
MTFLEKKLTKELAEAKVKIAKHQRCLPILANLTDAAERHDTIDIEPACLAARDFLHHLKNEE